MTTTNTSTLTITPTGDATGQDASANGGGEGEQKAAPAISFATDADFQRKVDDLLKERLEREQKKAEQKAQKAREDVLAEMAAKNGEWHRVTRRADSTKLSLLFLNDEEPKNNCDSSRN